MMLLSRLRNIIGKMCSYALFKVKGVEFTSFASTGVPKVFTSRNSRFVIGDHFQMHNCISGNPIGYANPCIFYVADGCCLEIGNSVGFSQVTIVAMADVKIGNNVKLGGGVKLYTSDFHSLDYLKRRDHALDMAEKRCAPITVGDDAFIGAGSIILKGVSVGARSIVGAGSVVTKSIPDDEVWAGNPARFIRHL